MSIKNKNKKGLDMINKRRKVVLASLLAGVFVFQQSMLLSVMASNISGVTPTGNVYNINPATANGGTGIRNYENFDLSQGDIANLIMHLNGKDLDSFINLVDNKVTINGLLNTVGKNGNFANGKAIFISPKGVVVGSSGVLNVGSFTAISPTGDIYKGLKDKGENLTVSDAENIDTTGLGGLVEINGKVLSRGDVKIYGNGVSVGGSILANVNDNSNVTTQAQFDTLFNKLVNTDGIVNSNGLQTFAKDGNGNIEIRSAAGINVKGNVVNYAKGTGSKTHIYNQLNDDSGVGTKIEKGANITANAGDLKIENNMGNMDVAGNITNNNGKTTISNTGFTYDNGTYTSVGNSKLTMSGNVKSNGDVLIRNTGSEGMDLTGTVTTTNGKTTITNGFVENNIPYTTGGMNITGNVTTTNGDLEVTNYASGVNGLNITNSGKLTTTGNANITNYGTAGLNVTDNAVINTTGNATITNHGARGLNFKNNAKSASNGTTTLTNHGEDGLNLNDSSDVAAQGNLAMYNDGAKGITIQPNAKAHSDAADVTIENKVANADTTTGAVRVQGHIASKGSTSIKSTGGDVILGDDSTNENVKAGKNINIETHNASILNYAHNSGVEKLHAYDTGNGAAKTFLVADGDLTMYAENGRIGDPVQGYCESGNCTGISEKAGTRDFNKSINANVKGKVKATTVDTTAAKENEYVINYAAIDSDMNLDSVNANGRVILTVDESSDGNHTQYNINNVATNDNDANIEGWGLSVISSGNIGSADKKVTFNQTKAGTLRTVKEDGLTGGSATAKDGYGMDVLANGDINMKALDDKKNQVNNVCSMVSRHGSIDVEFGGNTYIDEVTAEKNVKLVTRGKTMEINHLGTVPTLGDNGQLGKTYNTYLGEGDRKADPEYDMSTPDNAIVKALDINKYTRGSEITPVDDARPTGTTETYDGMAGSTAVVRNGMLEITDPNGTGNLDITADHVYGNGIAAHFTDDGFTKEVDNRTNPTIGGNTPSGHAVRPDDVIDTGRDYHERNYYYPEGDGDIPDPNRPDDFHPATPDGNVDPDDGIVDGTPLIMPVDPDTPNPPIPPTPDPDKPHVNPDNPNNPSVNEEDDRLYWKKQDDNFVQAIDKRQYMRFDVRDNKNPVAMEKTNNGISELLDVSRGGIAVKQDGSLKVGDVIPVHITYADLDINADVKVVSATTSRAGAEFVNLDKATANQLLYLSILLEDANNVAYNK